MLQSLVPLNALTADHLGSLLRNTRVEVAMQDQVLCQRGDCDNSHLYLLSGSVRLEGGGRALELDADAPEAFFPLAHHQPRLESVVAASDCQYVRFDSDRLDSMLAWDQAASYIILDITGRRDLDEDADWMLTLLRSNLFYKVPPINIREVLNRFRPQFVQAGDVILRQGERGDCCYFIKEGVVGIYRERGPGNSAERVAQLGAGRCFGEDALVDDAPRNAMAVMEENGVLMRLDKHDFQLLLKSPPADALSLADVDRALMGGAVLVDVRSEAEYERAHAAGALHMPLNILKLKSRLLRRDRHYILYCNSGRRSGAAAVLLAQDGFHAEVLRHGVEALPMAQRLRFLSEGDATYLLREAQLARTS